MSNCQLYLISPLEVGGDFPDRLARALDAGPVAAFQFRVKGIDEHEAARLAAPLQATCAARDVAFIVNDSISLAKRLGADGVHLGQDDVFELNEHNEDFTALDPIEERLGSLPWDTDPSTWTWGTASDALLRIGIREPTRNQAIVAARNMCGDPQPYAEIPWGWSDQLGVNLQLLGAPLSVRHAALLTLGSGLALFGAELADDGEGRFAGLLDDLARLQHDHAAAHRGRDAQGAGFQGRDDAVVVVGIAGQHIGAQNDQTDRAARVGAPSRRQQAREGGHEVDAVVARRERERVARADHRHAMGAGQGRQQVQARLCGDGERDRS